MELRNMRVEVPTGPIVLVVALLCAIAIALVGWYAVSASTPSRPPHGALAANGGFPGPDARERNAAYAAAQVAKAHESADGLDRNAQLTYAQMLAKFNDKSPDAQERNITISGR
jgi:hypothetical protein